MSRRLVRSIDFWSGLVLIGLALAVWGGVQRLPMGGLGAIGPGLFPRVLAVLTGVIGAVLIGKAAWCASEPLEGWNPRPALLLALATGAFGLLIEPSGLPAAVIAGGAIAGLAGADARLREMLVFLPLAALAATSVFVWGLSLPLPVAPWLRP